jgi:hypothetical protein
MTAFIVILICSNALERDACTRDTARAEIRLRAGSPVCAENGAVWMADLASRMAKDEYYKVRCESGRE